MPKKFLLVSSATFLIIGVALVWGAFGSVPFLLQKATAQSTVQSSTASIAAFAYDWWWSKQYYQDGRYGETKVSFAESLPADISSAKLTVAGSYSQQSGSASAEVYIDTVQQVTPKDSNHDKGSRWYGDAAVLGTKAGTFSTGYSGATTQLDVTSFISDNPATVYYVAVKNLATADIGISKIQLEVVGATQETKKSDGSSCSVSSECSGGYCVHYICRSSAAYCGDDYCDSSESCSSCAADCGACKKSDGSSCALASECSGGYCVHSKCRSSSSYCGDDYCDIGETCTSCSADCGSCPSTKTSSLTFTSSGGTQDAGVITYLESPYTWAVSLPSNFAKVETAHYDKNNPTAIRKYMGWDGYLTVNNQTVWEFKSWNSTTGGLIYDGSLGQEVYDSSGVNKWIDGTEFFKAGTNTVVFGHNNSGDGIGLKIKVTIGEVVVKKANGSSCSVSSECSGGYCVHYICRSSAAYCGDDYCDSSESCSSCAADCGACKKSDGSSCALASECSGGYCVQGTCSSVSVYCGDNICQSSENCKTCSQDCRCGSLQCCSAGSKNANSKGCVISNQLTTSGLICCSGKELTGECCIDDDCSLGKVCANNKCVEKAKCGDGVCQKDKGENCLECEEDCACSESYCCVPSSFAADDKGCVMEGKKTNSATVCCSGKKYSGECCSNSECHQSKECTNHFCTDKRKCGDGFCDYDKGETCQTCKQDCSCDENNCCSPKSEGTDNYGCIGSSQKAELNKICCSGDLQKGNCCSLADCSPGQECVDGQCKEPEAQCGNDVCDSQKGESCACSDCSCPSGACCEPASDNKDKMGCVASGKKVDSATICCQSKIKRGNCCLDSDCGSGERCLGYHCSKFIDQFYKYYFRDKVFYNGGFVAQSDVYLGLSTFYKRQATEITLPVSSLGKFVKALDALSDTTRSVVSLDILGMAANTRRFLEEMDDWEIKGDPHPVQDNVLWWYGAAGLLYEGADKFLDFQPAVNTLMQKLPLNKVLKGISEQHKFYQQKIISEQDLGTMFYFEVADFIMDSTLLDEVQNYVKYDVMDYMKKIELSLIARELGWLYQKAENHTLAEKEAYTLMALETRFWVGVSAKAATDINFEQVKQKQWSSILWEALGANSDGVIADATAMRNSAESWITNLQARRGQLFKIYFGLLKKDKWTKAFTLPFDYVSGFLMNALKGGGR